MTRSAFSRTLILSPTLRSETRKESWIFISETSILIDSGMSAGRHSMRISCVTMFRMPPSLTPAAIADDLDVALDAELLVEEDADEIDVQHVRVTGSSARSRIITWR